LEVGNALVVAERRGVIQETMSTAFLERLGALPIDTDPEPLTSSRIQLLTLARSHRLSVYDAAYLELSLRVGGRLASFDRRLRAATDAAGGRLA